MFSISASLIIYYNKNSDSIYFIFIPAILIGISQAIVSNSVVNLICEMIGSRGDNSGLVFG